MISRTLELQSYLTKEEKSPNWIIFSSIKLKRGVSNRHLLMEDSDDEDAHSLDIESNDKEEAKNRSTVHNNDDKKFEGEFGYSLVKALRGKTTGRRLKRALFKFGCFQFFCNFPLFIMTILVCK